jgi:HD superfamily phosphohydrolase
MSSKRLRVPKVDVPLSDTEVAVTQTRQFQRLFYLKQLGLAYLIYPAATHTRGAHSIQCLFEASRILAALHVPDNEAQDVRMAALLHDIGHIPFSHTLEDEHSVFPKHDRPERLRSSLDLLLADLGTEHRAKVEAALPILHAISSEDESTQSWKSDVVGNTVCADLLAYIAADAACTGIEKRPGYYRIYEYFTREHDRLCIRLTKGGLRNDIVSAVMDLLDMRYALTERVIFHHAKCVASAMLARAVRLCGVVEDSNLLRMGDERFVDYLETLAKSIQSPEGRGASNLVNALQCRRLYQRVFKISREARESWDHSRREDAFCAKWRNPADVAELLLHTEDALDLPRGSLVLWCPQAKAGMKLARAKVVWDSADGLQGPIELRSERVKQQFPGVGKRVETIEDQYRDLWTFWIGMDRSLSHRTAAVVRSLEEQIGISCDEVFEETYLYSIPGYRETVNRSQRVRQVWETIQPRVEEMLVQQSALDGQLHIDDVTIRKAITTAVQVGASSPKKADNDQVTMFPRREEANVELDRNESREKK